MNKIETGTGSYPVNPVNPVHSGSSDGFLERMNDA
jgi:hypothetical protein